MVENIGNHFYGGFGYLFNIFFDEIKTSNDVLIFHGEDIIAFQSNAYGITGDIDSLLNIQSLIKEYPNMPEVTLGFSYDTSTEFCDVNKDDNLEWLGNPPI